MYDRVVDVPRLVHTYVVDEDLPHPLLTTAREALSAHYLPELGEPFVTAGCCFYRDGRDSVAWHGDTIGRGKTPTPWWRSCRSATRAAWPSARAAAASRSRSRWATETWS